MRQPQKRSFSPVSTTSYTTKARKKGRIHGNSSGVQVGRGSKCKPLHLAGKIASVNTKKVQLKRQTNLTDRPTNGLSSWRTHSSCELLVSSLESVKDLILIHLSIDNCAFKSSICVLLRSSRSDGSSKAQCSFFMSLVNSRSWKSLNQGSRFDKSE